MFTPQQIEQVSFGTATFHGYDKRDVDAFLEPLVDDYITLYKENALLKSKMRVLVGKLEEYRKNEASMKDAIVNAQKTCDLMVKEAESKCALMLSEANLAAAENTRNARALMAEENKRVEQARQMASAHIDELQTQLQFCIEKLEDIKCLLPYIDYVLPNEDEIALLTGIFEYFVKQLWSIDWTRRLRTMITIIRNQMFILFCF
jgi:cell division initiation protein